MRAPTKFGTSYEAGKLVIMRIEGYYSTNSKNFGSRLEWRKAGLNGRCDGILRVTDYSISHAEGESLIRTSE